MSYYQRMQRRRRNRTGALLLSLAVLGIGFVLGVLGVVGYVLAVAASAPDLGELKPDQKAQTSVVYAADGSRLGYVQSDEIRTPIKWRDMPADLRNATVAIEDERFHKHEGVDLGAIVRAGIKDLESGDAVQGGSTITQQLVRSLYIKDPKRNFARKIREAKLASELEKKRSKRWILQNYLNVIPYGTVGGRTAIGAEAAAQTYFNKHARDLTLPEAALIAGLPQAPSEYNPFRNPTAALQRRNDVLKKMADNGFLSRGEAEDAYLEPLRLRTGTRYTERREPYFFDYVQDVLIKRYGVGVYRRGGLKVYTTVDPKLQDAARKAIARQLNQPKDPSSAVVSIDPSNGYIRAMASSGTYKDRSFNLAAQAHRQPGSAFKTFVLTAALLEGINPATKSYVSRPLSLNLRGYGPWQVKTYDNTYGGSMNLVRATLRSDNTVYAQLILDVSPRKVRETANKMGIETELDGVPAEGLGGLRLGVSPLEMADAYATLASGGFRNKPIGVRKVVFPDGKSEDLGKPERKRVFSDGVASEVTKILEQNIKSGTGRAADIRCPAAGKTGTTDNFNDAWFVGYTPKMTTAVWVGYPNAQIEMRSVHGIRVAGGTFPARIWHDYMMAAKGEFCGRFPKPREPVKWRRFVGRPSPAAPPIGSGNYAAPNNYSGPGNYSGPPSYSAPDTGTGSNPPTDRYRRYDPRLYDSPPQRVPRPTPYVPPPPASEPYVPRPREEPPDIGDEPYPGPP